MPSCPAAIFKDKGKLVSRHRGCVRNTWWPPGRRKIFIYHRLGGPAV